jgi:CHAD domain-containing protein
VEIEAKFIVSTIETFQRLQAVGQLASFALSAGRVKPMHDTYLDTERRSILAAGYTCRRREQKDGILVTLKAVRRAEGAIHRREELEVTLPVDRPPALWPPSPVRDRVLQLIGDAPLQPLFDLHQTRIVRWVSQGERQIAELSLDDVHLVANGREQAYLELEVELTARGGEEELAAIAVCLQTEWGLQAEGRSKFERALLFLGEPPVPSQGKLMTADERAVCERLVQRADLHGRRARVLLALDSGALQGDAGRQAGMSERRARHWLAEFRRKRLNVFPPRLLTSAQPRAGEAEGEASPAPDPAANASRAPQPWTLDMLFDHYEVDRSHARAVASHALTLFDHLAALHGLPPERRHLLEMAAMVHNIGIASDPHRHHVVGQQILLAHPPVGLSDRECQVVALTTLLHRKPITAEYLQQVAGPSLVSLPVQERDEILALAALVRVADGLDYSQGNSWLGHIRQANNVVHVEVGGSFAAVDAKRAQTKSDLWSLLFGVDLQFDPVNTGQAEPAEVPAAAEVAGQAAVRQTMPGQGEPAEAVPAAETDEPDATAPSAPDQSEPADLLLAEAAEPVLAPLTSPGRAAAGPGLQPDDSMAEAARKVLWFHFQRMMEHESGTRLGENIEELHDMRVAVRRMRAAWQVFGDHLDAERLRCFAKGLRRTGRVLGAVRDLDVFHEKTQRYLAELPPIRQADLQPLWAVWQAQRDLARQRLLAYLDSDRYARLKQQLGELLQRPGALAVPGGELAAPAPVPYRLRHVVPIAVYQRLAQLRAYDEWMVVPAVPLEHYHQLRIASKRLRYTLEFFEEVLGGEAKQVVEAIKELQDHLGDLQDAVVACNLLRDFLTWGTWGSTPGSARPRVITLIVAPGVTAYLAARQVELQQLIEQFPGKWANICASEFSPLVSSAVAVL